MSGGVWVASYVALWLLALGLTFAVVALLRQIGVLHARLHPLGVHFAGEGPELGTVAPTIDDVRWSEARLTLLVFTSITCAVCAELRPSVGAISRGYHEIRMREVGLEGERSLFTAYNVRSTPYFVAVDTGGTVRGRGVANSLEQIEELIDEALRETV